MNSRLEGSYLIVGAGKGVGSALAERLSSDGAAVGLVARSADFIEALADRLRESGGRALPISCDGLVPGALAAAAERLVEYSGRIDGALVVANAYAGGPVAGLSVDDLTRTIRVKAGLTLHAAQALQRYLDRFNPQRLIVVSTAGAYQGNAEAAPFNTAEWGVRGLVASIDAELGSRGLRTTLLAVMGSLREHQEPDVEGYDRLVSIHDVADAASWLLTRPDSQRYPEFRIEEGR